MRLFFKTVEVEASTWAFLIMGISIAVDFGRSRALSRAAKKYDSQALKRTLHFSTDIWSSSVVIGGLILVVLSERLGIPWLAKADAVAAIGVAGIVIYVSIQLGKKTVTALLDAVPAGLRDEVAHVVSVPGVQEVRRVRIRRSGPETFADITLTVSNETSLELAQQIATTAEASVRQLLPGADVLVYILPGRSAEEGIHTTIRSLANREGVHVHSLRVYEDGDGQRSVELHMDVSELLLLEQAHEKARRLEMALRAEPLHCNEVVLHIEPYGIATVMRDAQLADEIKVMQALEDLQNEIGLDCHPHRITVHRVDGELAVSLHCKFEASLPIGDVHAQTERIERLLRLRLPELSRVVIHTDPYSLPATQS
jgi:divalent metal cation (Fe/Co/Zn/Cd) transporter